MHSQRGDRRDRKAWKISRPGPARVRKLKSISTPTKGRRRTNSGLFTYRSTACAVLVWKFKRRRQHRCPLRARAEFCIDSVRRLDGPALNYAAHADGTHRTIIVFCSFVVSSRLVFLSRRLAAHRRRFLSLAHDRGGGGNRRFTCILWPLDNVSAYWTRPTSCRGWWL